MRLVPDGFVAALMAIEGISDARVFLHGTGGCRLYNMISATAAYPRLNERGTYDYHVPYFFGHPRIPSTYVDVDGYIHGAYDRLEDGIRVAEEFDCGLLAVVDSPGVALIGDDCDRAIASNGMEDKVIHVDEWLISHTVTDGFDTTLSKIIRKYADKSVVKQPRSVNVLGLSIMDKDWAAVREEIIAILEMMGLSANCILGAGDSTNEIRNVGRAEVCITMCPDMSRKQAEAIEELFGIPCIQSDYGAPIGFEPTRSLISNLAEFMNVSPDGVFDLIDNKERRVFDIMMGGRGLSSRIMGMSFAVAALPSVARSVISWLHSYLGMVPVSVVVDEGGDPDELGNLSELLSEIGCSDALGDDSLSAEVVLCEASLAVMLEKHRICRAGIDIGLENHGSATIIPRPIYLISGSMYVLDEIMKALGGFDSH